MSSRRGKPPSLDLSQAKLHYLSRLVGPSQDWVALHEDSEADFQAGFLAAQRGEVRQQAVDTFGRVWGQHRDLALRLEDFGAGFAYGIANLGEPA